MKMTTRLVALTAIALITPALTHGAPVTNTYAYQPLTIKFVARFAGTVKTNGTAITVTAAKTAKVNNAVLIQKFGEITKNNFSSKAQLMVKSLVTDQSYKNTGYTAVVVDGTKEVDVHTLLYVGTDGDEMLLSGKADFAKYQAALNSMAALYVSIHANDCDMYTYGCGMGETALVKENNQTIGYVQHWTSPESGYRIWEGEDAMFDGSVSIGHVSKVVKEVVQ